MSKNKKGEEQNMEGLISALESYKTLNRKDE